MLRQLSATHTSFRLNRPFRISRGVKTTADVVTVEIAERGIIGRGEGVPYARYGETLDSVVSQIEGLRAKIEAGLGRAELQNALPPGAARNALDCALWDLEAKATGRSVSEIAGWPEPGAVATAMTVGLDTPENMAEAARLLRDVPLIKIKVDAGNPLCAVRAVREAAPGPKAIVDPNESWTMRQLADWQNELARLGIDLLEQPLSADADNELEGFTPSVPLAADESGHVADDIAMLARRYQVVNIKLDKTGGLTAALNMVEDARAAGMGVMVGCMVSSSLSIAPAMIVATRCSFIDLDGPTWLADDLEGGVSERHGVLSPPKPGFWGSV